MKLHRDINWKIFQNPAAGATAVLKNIKLFNFSTICNVNSRSVQSCYYTGCIKLIGAVLKLIIFTTMVNRIIDTSRNERVTQQVYDTYLQMFDVTRHTSRR